MMLMMEQVNENLCEIMVFSISSERQSHTGFMWGQW